MTKNKYFEKLSFVAVFFSAHFWIIVFLCSMVFIFYVAMIGIEIVSAINHIPSTEDINKKMLSVNIRRDLIKKIDNFILMRQRETNDQVFKKNPFLPYQKVIDGSSDSGTVVSPETPAPSPSVSPFVSPSASPFVSPAVTPEFSVTPGPEFIQ